MFNYLFENNLLNMDRWLNVLGIGLVALHVILSWHVTGQTDQIALNSLYWLAIIALWRKRRGYSSLKKSSCLASGLGALLITLIASRSFSLSSGDSSFVRLLPGFIIIGFALVASGFKLHSYWREGILATVLMIPPIASNYVLEHLLGYQLQIIIAKTSTFFMHYIGFDVQREGIIIGLAHGAVEVEYGCTGGDILILLWQLCIPAILLFPVSRLQKMIMPLWSIALILLLGSVRVAIMAIVVNNTELFEYWHGSAGNQIFSTLGICIFGGICSWLTDSHLEIDDAMA